MFHPRAHHPEAANSSPLLDTLSIALKGGAVKSQRPLFLPGRAIFVPVASGSLDSEKRGS
jgi:hypothetical protein